MFQIAAMLADHPPGIARTQAVKNAMLLGDPQRHFGRRYMQPEFMRAVLAGFRRRAAR